MKKGRKIEKKKDREKEWYEERKKGKRKECYEERKVRERVH